MTNDATISSTGSSNGKLLTINGTYTSYSAVTLKGSNPQTYPAWEGAFSRYADYIVLTTVSLNKGSNTIRLANYSGGGVNIDSLKLVSTEQLYYVPKINDIGGYPVPVPNYSYYVRDFTNFNYYWDGYAHVSGLPTLISQSVDLRIDSLAGTGATYRSYNGTSNSNGSWKSGVLLGDPYYIGIRYSSGNYPSSQETFILTVKIGGVTKTYQATLFPTSGSGNREYGFTIPGADVTGDIEIISITK